MSWLFSRALVEAFSEDICSDGAPCAPLSGNPTPQAYLPPDRMTDFSRPSRFGMTFSPLTADRGEALLTSYLAAFRARTSASQAREPASTVPAAACGPTWRASLARFDPATSSWKTAQRSLLGDSDECSVTWPRSGMTADGQCWELPTLERRISGTGSGLSQETWPIPRCHMTRPVRVRMDVEKGHKSNLEEVVAVRAMWPTPRASETFQGYETLNSLKDGNQSWMGSGRGATLTTAVMARNLWPTPQTRGFTNDGDLMALGRMCDSYEEMSRMAYRAADKKKQQYWRTPTCPNGGRSVAHVTDWRSERTAYTADGKKVQVDLAQAVKRWPAPTVCGNHNRKGASPTSGDGLATAVLKCATPTARDWRSGKASQATMDRNSRPLSEQIGGSLNPTWVEWLMGWPLGWTDLKPLATDKSRCAQPQHGDC